MKGTSASWDAFLQNVDDVQPSDAAMNEYRSFFMKQAASPEQMEGWSEKELKDVAVIEGINRPVSRAFLCRALRLVEAVCAAKRTKSQMPVVTAPVPAGVTAAALGTDSGNHAGKGNAVGFS